VLLALDIDNTIMSMDSDLGSDHWFEWQRYLLENESDSPLLVANTFDGLLRAQGILFERGRMHPPEPDGPAIISQLQQRGIATILLTSRGPEFRAFTERELKRCGYNFVPTALPVRDVPQETFLPYDLADPESSGLTARDVETYKLSAARPVSYANGIFLTSGQHKGVMLVTLLHRSPRQIKAVVYADDNVRHVGAVFSAAFAHDLDVTSFQYQQEDIRVQRFNYSGKKEVTRAWKAVERSLEPAVASTSTSQPRETFRELVVPSSPRKSYVRRRGHRARCCR
jgi:hypothetical protein